jgi:hypothetical protein
LVYEFSVAERTIVISDAVKNAPQLRVGLVNARLSEGIFIRVDHVPWNFFRCGTVLLLGRDITIPWDTGYANNILIFL